MNNLELKIPPVILMIIFSVIMFCMDMIYPITLFSSRAALLFGLLFIMSGIAIILTGAIAFRKAQTTVNPTKPETSSSLVKCGIYSVTRNPMYVGMASSLLGIACYLSNPITLSLVIGFMLYMNRFQIQPEEKFLSQLFQQEYREYCSSVRRWL